MSDFEGILSLRGGPNWFDYGNATSITDETGAETVLPNTTFGGHFGAAGGANYYPGGQKWASVGLRFGLDTTFLENKSFEDWAGAGEYQGVDCENIDPLLDPECSNNTEEGPGGVAKGSIDSNGLNLDLPELVIQGHFGPVVVGFGGGYTHRFLYDASVIMEQADGTDSKPKSSGVTDANFGFIEGQVGARITEGFGMDLTYRHYMGGTSMDGATADRLGLSLNLLWGGPDGSSSRVDDRGPDYDAAQTTLNREFNAFVTANGDRLKTECGLTLDSAKVMEESAFGTVPYPVIDESHPGYYNNHYVIKGHRGDQHPYSLTNPGMSATVYMGFEELEAACPANPAPAPAATQP